MSIEDHALPIPDEVAGKAGSDQVTELIRVWWDETAPRMIIRPALRDPATVGAILAELSWHFSNAYAQKSGIAQADALKAIRDAWTQSHERVAAEAAAK